VLHEIMMIYKDMCIKINYIVKMETL